MYQVLYRYFPLIAFLFIWVFVLSLHRLELYNIKPVSVDTYWTILLGIFSLVSGYLVYSVYDTTDSKSAKRKQLTIKNESLLIKLLLILVAIQLLGAFLIFYEISFQIGGFSTFFNRPLLARQFVVGVQNGYESARVFYRIGNYLTNIGFLSVLLGGLYFSTFTKSRVFGLVPLISLLISQLVTLGRYKLVTGIVFFITAYLIFSYFLNKKKRQKRILELIIFIIVSTSLIGVISYFILKFRSPLEVDILSLVKKTLYLYFAGGITALDNFLSSDFKLLLGESSFRSVFKWLTILNLWPDEGLLSVHNDFTLITPNFSGNTYTFTKSLYQDFGLFGLIFIPFIWGAITYKLCTSVLFNFSLVKLYWLCILTFSLIISFYSFYFQSITSIIFWFIIIILIQKVFSKHIFQFKNTHEIIS